MTSPESKFDIRKEIEKYYRTVKALEVAHDLPYSCAMMLRASQ
jgi:hypothetical protein